MKKFVTFIFFILLACSEDATILDAVVPTPTVTFTLVVAASEGGIVSSAG